MGQKVHTSGNAFKKFGSLSISSHIFVHLARISVETEILLKSTELYNIPRNNVPYQTLPHAIVKLEMEGSEELNSKVVLMGDSGTGKTSIIQRYVNNTFSADVKTTIGASFRSKAITCDSIEVVMSIWDTAGQDSYKGLVPMYYRNASLAIVVFDITNRKSFEDVRGWIDVSSNVMEDTLLILCGNKIDIEEERQVSPEEAGDLARQLSMAAYCEVSAKTGIGITRLFETAAQHIVSGMLASLCKTDSLKLAPLNLNNPSDMEENQTRPCC